MNAVAKISVAAQIPDDEDCMTMADLVKRMKLNRATIYRMITAGTFPQGKRCGGNSRRWTRRDYLNWLGTRD